MNIVILQKEDTSFLEKYLYKEQIMKLGTALLTGVPILITGKGAATDKSAVRDYLRKIGADAKEEWETYKGFYEEENEDNNENKVYFNIVLNKEIIPSKTETNIATTDSSEHIYRRFIVKGDDKQLKSFENMIAKKQLSREDLKLILQTIELNPDICE